MQEHQNLYDNDVFVESYKALREKDDKPSILQKEYGKQTEKLVKLGYSNVVEIGGINDWTGEVE